MTIKSYTGRPSTRRALSAIAAVALTLSACSNAKDRLLGVTDPDIIAAVT
jgi:hypothetical protein